MAGGDPCFVMLHHQLPSFIPLAFDNDDDDDDGFTFDDDEMMTVMMAAMYSMFGCLVDGYSHQATALHLTTLNIPPTMIAYHDDSW